MKKAYDVIRNSYERAEVGQLLDSAFKLNSDLKVRIFLFDFLFLLCNDYRLARENDLLVLLVELADDSIHVSTDFRRLVEILLMNETGCNTVCFGKKAVVHLSYDPYIDNLL